MQDNRENVSHQGSGVIWLPFLKICLVVGSRKMVTWRFVIYRRIASRLLRILDEEVSNHDGLNRVMVTKRGSRG